MSNTVTQFADDARVPDKIAAAILGVQVQTVRRWRWAGTGPRYRRIGGSVRYLVADLREFEKIIETRDSKPQEVPAA